MEGSISISIGALGGPYWAMADLQERVLLLGFQPVGAKQLETALRLGCVEAFVGALEERKDVIEHDGLEVDFVLVVEILGLELNLREMTLERE